MLALCVLVSVGPAGCAVYRPEPLPNDDALLADVTMVQATPGAPLPFDISDGIDIDEVATIAVLNNPDLRAVRAGVGVAQAQVFAAGLLPDPQVTVGSDNPTNQTDTQVNAYTFSIGYDVGALITSDPTRVASDVSV
jgi:cobalt-zinc-cadmium efflux system outer membrane protein